MKVFISWSGTTSRAVAEALHWWLPKVLQGVRPFVSAKDIDKGANWTVELARELEDAEFGVVCLTPDNLLSPWLNYETGAITRSVESRVCPVLHGVKKREVQAPLGQLQLTELDCDDVLLMMTSMNTVAGSPLSKEDLKDAVEIWWPRLEEKLKAIPVAQAPLPAIATAEPAQPEASDKEMLEQLLEMVRRIERRLPPSMSSSKSQAVKDSPHRTFLRRMRSHLNDHGLEGGLSEFEGDRLTMRVASVPQPLPGMLYQKLMNEAKDSGVAITLTGADGTSISFDKNGWSDEPPF